MFKYACVFICVCDAGWGRRLRARHFLSRTIFFMFTQNENIPPAFDISLPAFQNDRWKHQRHAASVRLQYVYKCVCVGVNPALAPVLGLHLLAGHKATRVQGSKGARPQQRPSFSQASGPLGGVRGGPVGFDGICWCLLLETLTKGLQLRLLRLHHKQCQLEKIDLLNFLLRGDVWAEHCGRSYVAPRVLGGRCLFLSPRGKPCQTRSRIQRWNEVG